MDSNTEITRRVAIEDSARAVQKLVDKEGCDPRTVNQCVQVVLALKRAQPAVAQGVASTDAEMFRPNDPASTVFSAMLAKNPPVVEAMAIASDGTTELVDMKEPARAVLPVTDNWKHVANEWADTASSALVWLMNVRDGISKVEDAIDNVQVSMADCRALELGQPAAPPVAGWVSVETKPLKADDVQWVVNDNAELGVKIGNQFFFLYKGDSLVYESGRHDDGTPMMWREVGKREFGECCHPVKFYKDGAALPKRYTDTLEFTPGLSFGKPEDANWKPLPPAPAATPTQQNQQEQK